MGCSPGAISRSRMRDPSAIVSFIGVVEIFRVSQNKESALFNFTPYLATAVVFLAVTIPLARLTDWLSARDRRRYLAGVAR